MAASSSPIHAGEDDLSYRATPLCGTQLRSAGGSRGKGASRDASSQERTPRLPRKGRAGRFNPRDLRAGHHKRVRRRCTGYGHRDRTVIATGRARTPRPHRIPASDPAGAGRPSAGVDLGKGLLKVRLTPDLWGREVPADMPVAHPKEFREDVVAVARRGDAPIAQVAKAFGISESCLRNWMHRADVEDGHRPGITKAGQGPVAPKPAVGAGERGPAPGRGVPVAGEPAAGSVPNMRYPLVLDLAADGIPVEVTCGLLGFSRQWVSTRGRPTKSRSATWSMRTPPTPLIRSTPTTRGSGTGSSPTSWARRVRARPHSACLTARPARLKLVWRQVRKERRTQHDPRPANRTGVVVSRSWLSSASRRSQTARTASACGPLGLCVTSNSTRWASSSVL